MVNIHNAMGSALYSTLAAGTALVTALGGTAIYDTIAPQGTDPPYVVFFFSGGGDDNTSPSRARSLVYTVKTVGTAKLETEEIDTQVDALLHLKTLTVDSGAWVNYWTARTTDVAYVEDVGGELIWHRGGQYRIRIVDP